MPMSVVYTTVNGQILCENRGGVVSHFVSDPLGPVVMVRDNSQNTVYEAEYDPYGKVQSETGTNHSEFGYVGTLGNVKDSPFSLYVSTRYLLTNLGRWLTKDPFWPDEPGFVYAWAEFDLWVEPVGTSVGGLLVTHINALTAIGFSSKAACEHCKKGQGYSGGFNCDNICDNGLPVPDITFPFEDWVKCAEKCYSKMGRELAACMSECLGSKQKDLSLEQLFCVCSPYSCENGRLRKCTDSSPVHGKQECCAFAPFKCMVMTPPFAWQNCRNNHTACCLRAGVYEVL